MGMKFLAVVAAVLAVASSVSAQPQLFPTAALTYVNAAAVAPTPDCFPERQVACERHFSLYPNINCEGICGLCDLCDAAKVQNPAPGCEYCQKGVEACTATCKKGLEVCAKCGISFQG